MDAEQLQHIRQAALAFGNLAQNLATLLQPIAERLGVAHAALAGNFRRYLDTEEGKALMQGLARTQADGGAGGQ